MSSASSMSPSSVPSPASPMTSSSASVAASVLALLPRGHLWRRRRLLERPSSSVWHPTHLALGQRLTGRVSRGRGPRTHLRDGRVVLLSGQDPARPYLLEAEPVEGVVVADHSRDPLLVLLSLLRPQEGVDGGVEPGQEDSAAHLELPGHLSRQAVDAVPVLAGELHLHQRLARFGQRRRSPREKLVVHLGDAEAPRGGCGFHAEHLAIVHRPVDFGAGDVVHPIGHDLSDEEVGQEEVVSAELLGASDGVEEGAAVAILATALGDQRLHQGVVDGRRGDADSGTERQKLGLLFRRHIYSCEKYVFK